MIKTLAIKLKNWYSVYQQVYFSKLCCLICLSNSRRSHINIPVVSFNQLRWYPETGRITDGCEAPPFWLFDHLISFGDVISIVDKQRVLMHRHQGWNVRHGLCHIYMRYIYIYIWVVYSFCLFCCLFIIVTWWYIWCIVWQVASKRKYRHVW